MADQTISHIGGYLPLLRLDRKAAASALRFSGLPTNRQGARGVASWDEDAVTLATEAARMAMRDAAPCPARVIFASTSAPFFERAHAPILIDALHLPAATASLDVAGTRRCAVSALAAALRGSESSLIAAGERRPGKPGNALHLGYGDGGAAILTGASGAAKLIGVATMAHDFIDIYASRDHPEPYQAEERFIRDTAVKNILAPTILAACENAGIAPGMIAFAAMAEPVAGCFKSLTGQIGMKAANPGADLAANAGDLGAAHPLFALGLAFAAASPGDIVLLVGFGSGCDALLFEVTGTVTGASAMQHLLHTGCSLTDYVRFLSLSGALELDWGMRAEFEQKTAATVLERNGRDVVGFIGGRDTAGNVQFPKSRMPVNPEMRGPEMLTDVRLADEPASIVSITADRLNFSPDPPFYFGLVQFANGARLLMELTDPNEAGFAVADPVAMRFRIKSIDRKRGLRTYFWKAVPAARPALEG
jgi:3-hydroxy-3-methylglutaryl CoA synthase/uncharacterized OB-fold protein